MGSPDCPFNLNVSLTVIDKAFRDSLADGFQAIKDEVINAVSRVREIRTPEKPFSDLTYEIINGRLHWPGDRLSVVHHLRRNIVWLNANGGTEAQLNQAKLDLAVFREVQRRTFGLDDRQSVMWLAQKTPEPTNGVALQQIRREGDKLIQSSQLLPFDQQFQIDSFIEGLNEGRENASLSDDVGGWIVQGDSLDFQNELPQQIDQANQLVQPEFLPAEPRGWQQFSFLPEKMGLGKNPETNLPAAERPVPVSSVTGFWFEAAVAALYLWPTRQFQFHDPEEPTRLDLEGTLRATVESQTVDLEETVTIFEAPIVKPTVINLEAEEKFELLATTKQQLDVTDVEARCCFPVLEKPEIATIVFESAAQKKSTREIQVARGGKGKVETETKVKAEVEEKEPIKTAGNDKKVVFSVDNHQTAALKISRVSIKLRDNTKEAEIIPTGTIPIYKIKWPKMKPAEIPEYLWQWSAAGQDEIIDWPWFLVTIFYALLNTKVLLKEKIS